MLSYTFSIQWLNPSMPRNGTPAQNTWYPPSPVAAHSLSLVSGQEHPPSIEPKLDNPAAFPAAYLLSWSSGSQKTPVNPK